MIIETTRFGPIEVDETRIIQFKDGPLGFPAHKRFALIQNSTDPVFFWLQSVEDAGLAFVVCDPLAFVDDYTVPVREDDLESLGLRDLTDCQVLVIVNKVDDHLTINLLGPLVIGAQSLQARQFVLSDRRFSTRHPVLKLEKSVAPAAVRTA